MATKTRKAVIEVGRYTVREQPNGGWSVAHTLTPEKRISVHSDKDSALAAAKHYDEVTQ